MEEPTKLHIILSQENGFISLRKGKIEIKRGDLASVSNGTIYLCVTLAKLLNHFKCLI